MCVAGIPGAYELSVESSDRVFCDVESRRDEIIASASGILTYVRAPVWLSGCLVVWLSGCLVVWLSGCYPILSSGVCLGGEHGGVRTR